MQADKSKWTMRTDPSGSRLNREHTRRVIITRRDQCQLSGHPDWNSRGLWIESNAFAAIKKRQEAAGEQDKHPKLKWSEYAKGDTILNARFLDKNRVDRSGERTVQADRSKVDDAAERSRIYGVARKSVEGTSSTSQRTAMEVEVITTSRHC